ncbi:hypothetical protein [Viridibacillus arvi]|uniref:hypothetical protein n=1 Tax=Viridibacillus arvi TaxID=263475 RepID=UPI0034CDD0BF
MVEKAKNTQKKGEIINSLFKGNITFTKDVVIEEQIPRRAELGEYRVQLNLSNGLIVRMKTGSFNRRAASLQVSEAILYCEEIYGPVVCWNWVGEESIIRTPYSAFEQKDLTDTTTFTGKLANFIQGDKVDEISKIRKSNARKQKFQDALLEFKAKTVSLKDFFFGFNEEDYEYEEQYEIVEPEQQRTFKEKLEAFFFVEEGE